MKKKKSRDDIEKFNRESHANVSEEIEIEQVKDTTRTKKKVEIKRKFGQDLHELKQEKRHRGKLDKGEKERSEEKEEKGGLGIKMERKFVRRVN